MTAGITDIDINEPGRYWEYRVIMEVEPDGTKCFAIHTVFYRHDKPTHYNEEPATVLWTDEEEPDTALHILSKMADALAKPLLNASQFDKSDEQGMLGRFAKRAAQMRNPTVDRLCKDVGIDLNSVMRYEPTSPTIDQLRRDIGLKE